MSSSPTSPRRRSTALHGKRKGDSTGARILPNQQQTALTVPQGLVMVTKTKREQSSETTGQRADSGRL
ncbi:MAG TPA: hypothetical protein VGJ44_21035, partial [Kribbellaceae bacterium]